MGHECAAWQDVSIPLARCAWELCSSYGGRRLVRTADTNGADGVRSAQQRPGRSTFPTRATTVTFTPTAADSGATISVNNGAVQSGTTSGSFAVPWTRLPITVTAEDGTTTRTYYVSTTRFGT